MTEQPGLLLDWETADRITLLNLQNSREMLEQENQQTLDQFAGQDLPDYKKQDFDTNLRLITFMGELIKYYGG